MRLGLAILTVFFSASLCRAQSGRAQSSSAQYTITTLAGTGTGGYAGDGAAATSAQLNAPFALAVDAPGSVYVADEFNSRVRRITPAGIISTVAGNGTNGYTGDGGPAASAELSDPSGLAFDSAGNLYIADTGNNVVRKMTPDGNISTIAGSNSLGAGYTGDGGPATGAQLNNPSGLAVDSRGDLYIADTSNNVVRMVDTQGNISTIAGNNSAATGFSGDGGPATSAVLYNPIGVAVDSAGNLYVADGGNSRVRLVSAATGNIATFAGSGSGYSGDGGPAARAKLNTPKGIALDSAGNLYIADRFNNAIRMVNAAGIISTIAGDVTGANLFGPCGVAVDRAGNVSVADTGDNLIRLLTPVPQAPIITSNGVIGAGNFGALKSIAPGSWIEIYGSNLAADSRGWASIDFNGINAPTSLDGTRVTIGGQAASVDYISAGQVNAQVPQNVAAGTQQLTITTSAGTSAPYSVTVNPTAPGLDAPAAFNIGGTQYMAALFTDGKTYVLPPGTISGIISRQAKPGETIVIYGVGFGDVTPGIPAGQLVQQMSTLAAEFQLTFGQQPATLSYEGLAPGAVGLYQFNAVVPNVANSDAVPVTFMLNGIAGTQTLYTAIHN
ncbi:MAG: repeat containing protein [Bryobacterales bacterium]|nr:repeat containing protein [Bryobacterales bacterium]